MSWVAFETLKTNLNTLFSGVSIANWYSTIFCFLICSFLDIHLFLINCNLFRFRNRLWTFLPISVHLLLVSTRLQFTHFYSFTQGCNSFIKLDLKSGFSQLESSLASHSITTFQVKKEKNVRKDLLLGYILPRRN